MNTSDAAAALLGTSVSLAGLLLVFVGFIRTRAESMSNTRRADVLRHVAMAGLVPIVFALLCAWLSVGVLEGQHQDYTAAAICLKTSFVLTGWYGFIVFFVYL